jgi:hypothetical protein
VELDATLMVLEYLLGEPAEAAAVAPPPLGPTGGAALYPLEALNAVGGFDEQIFAYLEDVDLALRLVLTGHPCRLAAGARAVHVHSATLGAGSRAKNELTGFGRGYILGRYRVLASPRRALRAIACETAICAGQALVDHTVSGVPGRFRGYRAGRRLPARQIPEAALVRTSAMEALRRRTLRRRGPASLSELGP